MPVGHTGKGTRREGEYIIMQWWIVFYLGGKEIGHYTVRGTYDGELENTKRMLAACYGVSEKDIIAKREKR